MMRKKYILLTDHGNTDDDTGKRLDLFGYLVNELDNQKLSCALTDLKRDPLRIIESVALFLQEFIEAPFGKDENETDAQWHDRLYHNLSVLTEKARRELKKCGA